MESYIKQINDIRERRKKRWNSAAWWNKIISAKNQRLCVRREVEVGGLLLDNDKSNVIADKKLSYFYCFSSKFEVYVAGFESK